MSSALAIAAATAVLVDLLENRLIQHEVADSVGAVTITALPPDRLAATGEERSGLNLFLYRVTPDTRWRRSDAGAGVAPPAGHAAPLCLHLHYLLTAYGERDLESEILLGYCLQALHETPILDNTAIRKALAPGGDAERHLSPMRAALAAQEDIGLQHLTLCPEFLSMEDMSRLWSSLQARYRPSMTYMASAVTIEVQS